MIDCIIFCDIDGTIIPNYFNSKEVMSKEQLESIKRKVEEVKLSENIISLLQQIIKSADLVFLTGRPVGWKDLTYKLLSPIDKDRYKIYFPIIKRKWTIEIYYKFKLIIINNLAKHYDIIYVIDDMIDLLIYIKKHFKWDNKYLFLINGVFNPTIKNIVIKNRLM